MTISKTLTVVEHESQRVLTTAQLAEAYGCTTENIKKNFQYQKSRFVEGKHYFKLEGEELKKFKDNWVTKSYLVENNGKYSPLVGKNAKMLILWTKRGAARHCKMLDTDKAWEVFDELEDNYFKKINIPALAEEYRRKSSAYESGTEENNLTMEESLRATIILMKLYNQTFNTRDKYYISRVIERMSTKIYVLARKFK